MYLIPIAWIYVALMMSVAEATNTNGTVIGAVFTFLIYGLMPVGLVMYLLGTPGRKRKIREREMRENALALDAQAPDATAAESPITPDAGGDAAGDAVAPVRKEP
jgi:hypothetical protein